MSRRFSAAELMRRRKQDAESERWYVFVDSFPDQDHPQIMGPMTRGEACFLAERVEEDTGGQMTAIVAQRSRSNWTDVLEGYRDA